MTQNTVVYQARLHWVIFLWPVLMLFVVLYLGGRFPALYEPGLILLAVALCWLLMMWVMYQFSSLTIKKKHVVLRTGVLVRQTTDIPMNKIESIDIKQSIIGSLLQYGSLVITGTGGTRQVIHYVQRPLACRRHIEQLMHH